MDRVESFVSRYRFGTLLQLYMLLTSWENHNALKYYGEIPERAFVRGTWHRPWVDYSLGEELMFGSLVGNMRLERRGDRRFVQLTNEGHQVLQQTTDVLASVGYFRQRINMLHISQFNQFDDYEQLASEIWPTLTHLRHEFLRFAGIGDGMKVVELGCANGVFTLDGGLAETVGPSGFVVAVDPATAMLARARAKQQQLGIEWVSFRQGRAEEMPIGDHEFDAAIGIGFLHFTNRQLALEEMKRVVRGGGVIASMHPLQVNLDLPFLREWFAPILELAAKRQERPRDYLLDPNAIHADFSNAGLTNIEARIMPMPSLFCDPQKAIQHFVRGVGWFGEELSLLPWQAREDLIQELIERGRFVCDRYSESERVLHSSMQAIRARVPIGSLQR